MNIKRAIEELDRTPTEVILVPDIRRILEALAEPEECKQSHQHEWTSISNKSHDWICKICGVHYLSNAYTPTDPILSVYEKYKYCKMYGECKDMWLAICAYAKQKGME